MTSQPRDKTRDSTKHDTAKFGLDLHGDTSLYTSQPKTSMMAIDPLKLLLLCINDKK